MLEFNEALFIKSAERIEFGADWTDGLTENIPSDLNAELCNGEKSCL